MCFARESCRVEGVSLCPRSVPIRGKRERMNSKTVITLVTRGSGSGEMYQGGRLYCSNH